MADEVLLLSNKLPHKLLVRGFIYCIKQMQQVQMKTNLKQ
jgi:hypothetical protein